MTNARIWALGTTLGALLLCAGSSFTWADPTLHKTLRSSSHSAELVMEPNKVTVQLSPDTPYKPSSVLLTFIEPDNKTTTVELKSVTQTAPLQGNPMIYTTSSTLSPTQQSFIGLELRVPLSRGKSEVFKLKE